MSKAKLLVALGGLAVVTTLLLGAALKAPNHGRVALLRESAVGDTLTYGVTLQQFGARATSAEITVRPLGTYTVGWQTPVRQQVTALTSPFLLVNPTAWDSASFALYAWGRRDARVSVDSTLIAAWTVVRSPAPPPGGVIDSSQVIAIYVRPKTANVNLYISANGGVDSTRPDSIIFCAYARLRDSRIVPASNNLGTCPPVPADLLGVLPAGTRPFMTRPEALALAGLLVSRFR